MKAIFLDHDGVICLGSEFGSRFKKQKKSVAEVVADNNIPIQDKFDNFNAKAIKVLNKILEETGAEIVVSSDWRIWATLEELGEFYELQGIIKKPIAFTPRLKDFDKDSDALFHYKGWYERVRILEIKYWLKNNPVDAWVAVDDMSLGEYIYFYFSLSHLPLLLVELLLPYNQIISTPDLPCLIVVILYLVPILEGNEDPLLLSQPIQVELI
jgi:hypothetical protein